MPRHHFRIRFRLPDGIVLKSDKASLRLTTSTGGSEYVLDAVGAKTLNESQWLLIKDAGDGFATEGEAREAGRQAKNAVMWWGAKARAGVDVGDDTSKAVVTQAYIDLYREEQGVRLLNELHGLQVYEEDPELPTQFVAASVEPKVLKSTEDFARHFREAVDRRLEIDEKATLAFELYGLSHFEAAERARLLTLISAIEAASEAKPRGPEAVAHVERMIELTRASELPNAEIASMVGSLEWLRQESISKTCRDFVETFLGGGQYGGKPAKKFFQDCYAVRSKLVHSGKPSEKDLNFGILVAELDRMVADLLTESAGHSTPSGPTTP